MKIAIGCDHAAFKEKQKILKFLNKLGHVVVDLGTYSNESVNYPEYGHAVANKVVKDEVDKGIVLCGTGIGISMAANKIKGSRVALCTSVNHAEMSRKHNDANILALGSRMTDYKLIESIISVWLETEFKGGRHLDRINMIEII
tara:strand:+ start:591 stop:1022 length:432 start_codon:yes stop_codon:yes gene_type:complete